MSFPRFRLRTLMIVVAVVSIVLWSGFMAWRMAIRYGMAEMSATEERYLRDPDYTGDAEYVQSRREAADYEARLRRKYAEGIWRPWRSLAPDPPTPDLRGKPTK